MKLPIVSTTISRPYFNFCVIETTAINSVGIGTLVFQDDLREICPIPAFYEFWFNPPIPTNEIEHLMTYMIAGWIFVAATLQASINFDDDVPRKTKLVSLYAFGICDWIWVILMIKYYYLFSLYHMLGSSAIIYRRFGFILKPSNIFSKKSFVTKIENLENESQQSRHP